MTSLREELEETLQLIRHNAIYDKKVKPKQVEIDEIISIIEKRIDSRIKSLDEMIEGLDKSNKDAIISRTGVYVTKIEALDSLKNKRIGFQEVKEILKWVLEKK